MSRFRASPLTLFAVAAATALLTGCGSNLLSHLQSNDEGGYELSCAQRADKHIGDVNGGNYYLPEFFVSTWPGELPQARKIDEKVLVEALARGTTRYTLITARAGLGKSRLAESIEAQNCKHMPVFLVDLAKDVAPLSEQPGDPLMAVLRGRLGLTADVAGDTKLKALLASQRWLLLADGLEEVELLRRAKVIAAIEALRKAYPTTAQVIVMARPSVLDVDYGMEGFDARLQILPIDADRADRFFKKLVGDPARAIRLKAFLHSHGFDAKATFGFQQIYPLMATYRDVIVLRKLAETAAGGAGVSSYAAAHEHLVAARLAKELGQVNWGPREVLDMVDRMVGVHREKEGAGQPFFTVAACLRGIDPQYGWTAVDAGVGGDSTQRRRQICERALQSVLFEASSDARGEKGIWHFASGTVADLFNARWINSQLARLPEGQCSTVEANANLFMSGSTVRFLVGQPMVQRCLGTAMRILCSDIGAQKARHLEQVVDGIPADRRLELVALVRDYESGQGNNACVLASMDALAGTSSGH